MIADVVPATNQPVGKLKTPGETTMNALKQTITAAALGLSLVATSAAAEDWVYPNKGTKRDIGLSLISDAHNCLPAGFELACNG